MMCKATQWSSFSDRKNARTFFSLQVAIQVFFATSTVAQTVVPITHEPSHHLVISNPYVRVFEVEVPARAETFYHQHDYDYLYVAIGDANVTSVRLKEKPAEVQPKDGEVELAKGPFAHKAVNNGDRPFRNVTVELLGGSGESIREHRGEGSCGLTLPANAACEDEVIQTTKVEVKDIRLKGKAGLGPFAYPYLLVAVSDLDLRQSSQKGTTGVAIHAGSAFWNDQPGTKLENASGLAQFILIGFPTAKAP